MSGGTDKPNDKRLFIDTCTKIGSYLYTSDFQMARLWLMEATEIAEKTKTPENEFVLTIWVQRADIYELWSTSISLAKAGNIEDAIIAVKHAVRISSEAHPLVVYDVTVAMIKKFKAQLETETEIGEKMIQEAIGDYETVMEAMRNKVDLDYPDDDTDYDRTDEIIDQIRRHVAMEKFAEAHEYLDRFDKEMRYKEKESDPHQTKMVTVWRNYVDFFSFWDQTCRYTKQGMCSEAIATNNKLVTCAESLCPDTITVRVVEMMRTFRYLLQEFWPVDGEPLDMFLAEYNQYIEGLKEELGLS